MRFFGKKSSTSASDASPTETLAAISHSQAIIEFGLGGMILSANENFLRVMGYELGEIVGQHHRLFVEAAEAADAPYAAFWQKLSRGEFDTGEYKRLGKGGKEVWLQASYNPVFNKAGQPVKVAKIAADVTAQRLTAADASGQFAPSPLPRLSVWDARRTKCSQSANP